LIKKGWIYLVRELRRGKKSYYRNASRLLKTKNTGQQSRISDLARVNRFIQIIKKRAFGFIPRFARRCSANSFRLDAQSKLTKWIRECLEDELPETSLGFYSPENILGNLKSKQKEGE
jgi:hypothetical protein